MQIEATGLGKRFQRDWIFRGLTRAFRPGSATAVLGPNGAGKSTLLNTIAGQLLPTEGALAYTLSGRPVAVEDVPQHLAYAAPYLELLEELTLLELLRFHTQFKPLQAGVSLERLIDIMYLEKGRHQLVREFSSGMKQRLKLGLALYAAAPLLLLDEPTTNLDATGVAWYQEHVEATRAGRTLLLSSNVPAEYSFCDEELLVTDFQTGKR
ncbi:ATP-binding cassette domain-containing protein [Hymenobacter sp. BT439]|uniref:ATP-binding cassette domain-containing protein n=1 Tax=Hymenobacter properus TaxID=2791026 RepID=A0A931FGV7_9BACT|nr:ATP-binding cassette domain-containing protein [Hymenobacter properus]